MVSAEYPANGGVKLYLIDQGNQELVIEAKPKLSELLAIAGCTSEEFKREIDELVAELNQLFKTQGK